MLTKKPSGSKIKMNLFGEKSVFYYEPGSKKEKESEVRI